MIHPAQDPPSPTVQDAPTPTPEPTPEPAPQVTFAEPWNRWAGGAATRSQVLSAFSYSHEQVVGSGCLPVRSWHQMYTMINQGKNPLSHPGDMDDEFGIGEGLTPQTYSWYSALSGSIVSGTGQAGLNAYTIEYDYHLRKLQKSVIVSYRPLGTLRDFHSH